MKEPKAMIRVRDWDQLYENNRSREMKRTDWFPAPNDLSADSYVELVSHEHGAAHFGAWIALLMVASRAKPRGWLVCADGRPHTPESLARITRLPEAIVCMAIERLLAIGLLETGEDKRRKKSRLGPHPAGGIPQDPARKPQESAVEGKGIEHHHQEKNFKEKNGTRTEPQGTEPAGGDLAPEHSVAASSGGFSYIGDDDENLPAVAYASPEDELKALYRAQAGEVITVEVLRIIRANLELTGVSIGEFVAEARKHARNKWRSPAGFLRDLSKNFRAKTRVAAQPVTAAEAAMRDYKCPKCSSRTPDEGVILNGEGKLVPCTCASPEWIERQQVRGVFATEMKPSSAHTIRGKFPNDLRLTSPRRRRD